MIVKIKSRNEILTDIIRDAKKHPTGWHASFGNDATVSSQDYYIFHPNIGVYLVKEFSKNPFQTKGLGGKLARHLDEDITEKIIRSSGDFGIIQGDINKILYHVKKGIPPQQILSSALKGKDFGIKIPVQGHASTSQDTFHSLKTTFHSQQKKLKNHFEKMASDDGLYTPYG